MQQLLRYDVNIANAIVSVVKERNISDIVMGMHHDRTPGGSGIGRMAADLLGYSNVTTFFYHPEQPLTTVKRHLVIVPRKSRERGRVPALDAEITQPGREFECQDRLLRPGQHDAIPAAFARKTLVESRIRGFRLLERPNGADL